MTTAELEVTLPEHVWIAATSTEFPEATFRVLAAIPGDTDGFALIRIVGTDVEPILEFMEELPQVSRLSIMESGETEATVQIETTHPLLLFSAQASRIPLVMPVDIQDGTARVRVTGPRTHLSELGSQLHQHGLSYDVLYVREELPSGQELSSRQREVLLTAVELGYYDSPRRASLTDVADALGIAKSTCSEMLHRIESAIIEQFYEHESGPESASPPPMDPA